MSPESFASLYALTVMIAVVLFADTTGGLGARAWSATKMLVWPVTLACLIAAKLNELVRAGSGKEANDA